MQRNVNQNVSKTEEYSMKDWIRKIKEYCRMQSADSRRIVECTESRRIVECTES